MHEANIIYPRIGGLARHKAVLDGHSRKWAQLTRLPSSISQHLIEMDTGEKADESFLRKQRKARQKPTGRRLWGMGEGEDTAED